VSGTTHNASTQGTDDMKFEDVFELAKNVFEKHLPDVTIQFHPESDNDPCISSDDYGVTLDPCMVQVLKRIGSEKLHKVPGYSVSVWSQYEGDMCVPPDVDQNEIASYSNAYDAIKKFAEIIFAMKLAQDIHELKRNLLRISTS
jgi:hypothetical protein